MKNILRDLALEKRIDAYVKGQLDEEQAHQLWEDLLKHPGYIELLETELGLKAMLENQGATERPKSSVKEIILYQLQASRKWVAAAVIVITTIVGMNLMGPENSHSTQGLALAEINLRQQLITAPVTRSQNAHITGADSLLNLGFKAAIQGDVDGALQLYNEVVTKFGDDPAAVRALLNIGMIHYNTGYFMKAISSFKEVIEKVSEQPIAEEKAYWYLGNAYIIQDKFILARDAIQKAYDMDGIFNRPSANLLESLDKKLANQE
ncbi:MAG TPA: tetratricopeptide repeat protein [Balneolaceae bacterium]|nr:tetratricopeptide repeat protein [Balneolaceae bacterium]